VQSSAQNADPTTAVILNEAQRSEGSASVLRYFRIRSHPPASNSNPSFVILSGAQRSRRICGCLCYVRIRRDTSTSKSNILFVILSAAKDLRLPFVTSGYAVIRELTAGD